jgi:quercetin dioxygenase-like cupin family protein
MSGVVNASSLPGKASRSFEGHLYGSELTVILVDAAPGDGPRLHRHPYEELFIVQEGVAVFTRGDASVEARAGDFVVVPPGTPHKFVNTGDGALRMVAIHHAPRFDTEWLEQ